MGDELDDLLLKYQQAQARVRLAITEKLAAEREAYELHKLVSRAAIAEYEKTHQAPAGVIITADKRVIVKGKA